VVDQWRYWLDIPNNLTILEGNVTGIRGAAFQIALMGLHHCGGSPWWEKA